MNFKKEKRIEKQLEKTKIAILYRIVSLQNSLLEIRANSLLTLKLECWKNLSFTIEQTFINRTSWLFPRRGRIQESFWQGSGGSCSKAFRGLVISITTLPRGGKAASLTKIKREDRQKGSSSWESKHPEDVRVR